MGHRARPDGGDDVAALAAVWGRQASATAAPHERPRIEPPEPPRRRIGRHLLAAGAGLAAVVAIVATVLVVGGDDEGDDPASRRDRASSTTQPVWEPGWASEVACPRLEVTPELRTTACPLATDEERVYVLVEQGGSRAGLVAVTVDEGTTDWEVPFPDGARKVLRYPSVVLVVGPDQTHAVDPVTGEVRWSAPGAPVAPLGRDRVLLSLTTVGADDGATTTMTVADAGTGASVLTRSGPPPSLSVHPCEAAGLVLVSELQRLTAHEVADGAERWSIDAPYHDDNNPIVCSADVAVKVESDGRLLAHDVVSGATVATTETAVAGDAGLPRVIDVVAGTVVVRSRTGWRGTRPTRPSPGGGRSSWRRAGARRSWARPATVSPSPSPAIAPPGSERTGPPDRRRRSRAGRRR